MHKIYSNMIDHNVNSRRPCYSQVYVQPQLLIESHIRCELTANHGAGGLSDSRVDRTIEGSWESRRCTTTRPTTMAL